MEELTLEKMKELAEGVIYNAFGYSHTYGEAFSLLRRTGIRVTEIDKENWSMLSEQLYVLRPKKANFDRYFSLAELGVYFQLYYNDPVTFPIYTSYASLREYFLRSLMPYRIMYEKKEVDLHFFRHLFIRELKNKGMSFIEIKEKMGYKSNEMLRNYLYRPLYIVL